MRGTPRPGPQPRRDQVLASQKSTDMELAGCGYKLMGYQSIGDYGLSIRNMYTRRDQVVEKD